MRKKIFTLQVACVISLINIFGQTTTFEYLLPTQMSEIVFDILEADDNFIYIVGTQTRPHNGLYKSKGMVVKLNFLGQFIDSALYFIPEKRYLITDILLDGTNRYLLAGMSTDSIPDNSFSYANVSIELKIINSYLDIIESNCYPFPSNYKSSNIVAYRGSSDNILVGGTIKPEYTPRMYFLVFNSNLDSLKSKIYLDKFRTCYYIRQLNDTTYWICDGEKSSYYLIDENLNITDYDYARPHWNYTPGIKWDTETSFYLAGQWNGGPDDDIGLYKQFDPIDSTGNIFNSWGTTDTMDIPALLNSSLDFKNKDSIFIGGTTNFSFYFAQAPSWYFILQTDSNLNVRWERFYGGDARYTMSCIKASNDGGCIVAGNRYDFLNDTIEQLDIHILKLNSEGLLVNTPEHPGIEMHEAIVFPNPGTNQIRLRIASQYRHSTFDMFDINGKLVISKRISGKWAEINTGHLSSGTYVYRIYSMEGLSESGKWIKQ
jgi:hypothetical protein